MRSAIASALVTAVAAVAIPLVAAPAAADPSLLGEIPVQWGVTPNGQLAQGPDGNMWMPTDTGFVRITPDGVVQHFDGANSVGMAAGPGGTMWMTQYGGVATFAVGDPASVTSVPIPHLTDPRAITMGPDANLWTASGDKVYRIPPANPAAFTEFTMPGVNQARAITASATSIWVAYLDGDKVLQINPADGHDTPYSAPGGMQGIAAGDPIGGLDQVAYTQSLNPPQYVARLTAGGAAINTDVPTVDPFGITFGRDHAYWIAQFNGDNLGRLTPDGTYSTPIAFTPGSGPRQLAPGPDDSLWVSLDSSDRVAKVGSGPPLPIPTPPPTTPPTPAPLPVITANFIVNPEKIYWVGNRKRGAVVRIGFRSTPSGGAFQCRIKPTHEFRLCTSPRTYRLRPGNYTFEVRTFKAGYQSGPSVAQAFRVVYVPQVRVRFVGAPQDFFISKGASRAQVQMEFKSIPPGADLSCRMARSASGNFHRCTSPESYRLRVGDWTYYVKGTMPGFKASVAEHRSFTVWRQ